MKLTRKTRLAFGLATTALVILTLAPLIAQAAPAAMLRHRLGDTPLGRFVTGQVGRMLVLKSELDVTPKQREQVVSILRSHRAEIAKAAKPVVEKRRVLREATLAEKIDEARIRAAAEDLGKSLGDLAVLGAKIKGQVRDVLTPEQRDRIKAFHAENDQVVDKFIAQVAESQ